MALITKASQLRAFNQTLGVHETDLSRWPTDFVAAVIEWSRVLNAPPEED